MNSKCPYCGEPLAGNDLIPPMNKRRRRLYDAVTRAGSKGITVRKLLPHMYTAEQQQTPFAWTVLRVQIHELNRTLIPISQRVKAINGSYFLFSTKEQS
jgi:hypothetical protein